MPRVLPLCLLGLLSACAGCSACNLVERLTGDEHDPGPGEPIVIAPVPAPGTGPAPSPGPAPAPGPTGGGFPAVEVEVDGQNVWPPSGPGCDALIRCCDAAAALHQPAELACRMFIAADTGDCPGARAGIHQYLIESGVSPPAACAP